MGEPGHAGGVRPPSAAGVDAADRQRAFLVPGLDFSIVPISMCPRPHRRPLPSVGAEGPIPRQDAPSFFNTMPILADHAQHGNYCNCCIFPIRYIRRETCFRDGRPERSTRSACGGPARDCGESEGASAPRVWKTGTPSSGNLFNRKRTSIFAAVGIAALLWRQASAHARLLSLTRPPMRPSRPRRRRSRSPLARSSPAFSKFEITMRAWRHEDPREDDRPDDGKSITGTPQAALGKAPTRSCGRRPRPTATDDSGEVTFKVG